jgi:hypothetical protein
MANPLCCPIGPAGGLVTLIGESIYPIVFRLEKNWVSGSLVMHVFLFLYLSVC